jgi:predicted nuclease of restriction endonuclease-like (RecB) superfamily
LENKYGRNFEEKNLRRMMQFVDQFTDKEIVVTVSRQLSWSHFLAIIPIKNPEAKLFYANHVSDQLMSVIIV